MIRIKLTPEENKVLTRLRNQTSNENSERALIVLLSHEGKSPKEISLLIKRNEHTVRLWLKRYKQNGLKGLNRLYSPGRPPKHKHQLETLFSEWFAKGPTKFGYPVEEWTVSMLCDSYLKITGNSISEDTITRALKKAGYSYTKAKKTVPANAPTKEEKKEKVLSLIDEIKGFIDQDNAVILSLDEAYLSSEPYLVRGWYKKNSKIHAFAQKEGGLHIVWCLEFAGTTIFLEKCQAR